MPYSIYLQPLIVESSSEPTAAGVEEGAYSGPANSHTIVKQTSSSIAPIQSTSKGLIVRRVLSNVPIISRAELAKGYQELGDALRELVELPPDNEWKIDSPVFSAARYVATELMGLSVPPPQVFNHGSESIVFNWSRENNELYLTVSADKMSALISKANRIAQRVEIDFSSLSNPTAILSHSALAQIDEPTIFVMAGGSSDPLVLLP